MLEIHCKAYRESFGDNFTCIIPVNIYGPHDNFDLEDGHVIPALVHKCFLAKQKGVDFVIRGSGTPLRQFIYSEDLAKLIMIVFERDVTENIILSVPESHEISIGDVGRLIARCYEYEDRITFDTSFSDGQFKKTVGIDRLSKYAPDFEFTPIADGLQKAVEWFVQNKV
jgi:GDP-L-fucose synthase